METFKYLNAMNVLLNSFFLCATRVLMTH